MSLLPSAIEYIYREIDDGRQVKLDLLQPANYDPATQQYKTLIFYHGGGLIGGSRKFLANNLALFLQQNWVVLSVDYHLLPEAGVSEIQNDVIALEAWLLKHHGEIGVDLERVALAGASAGGFVSVITCNTWTSIRPKAFLSLYGMSNTSSEWYTVAKAPGTMVAGFVCLDSLNSADYEHYFQADSKPVSEDYSTFQDLTGRLGLFFWSLREGKYKDILMQESGKIYNPLDDVTSNFPPTMAVHGEKDTVIAIRDSEVLVDVLKKMGVEAELVRVQDAEHGLNPPEKTVKFVKMGMDFLERFL